MNPRIAALDDDQVPSASLALVQQTRRALGMVPNLHRSLAHSPAALRAYSETVRALAGGLLPAALREQIAVAAAGSNRCGYCASAHTALGKAAGLDEAELRRNLSATSSDPRTEIALAFVRELIEERGHVSEERVRALRDAGFRDGEIVELIAHAGMNLFTNLFNVFNGTSIDFPEVEIGTRSCSC